MSEKNLTELLKKLKPISFEENLKKQGGVKLLKNGILKYPGNNKQPVKITYDSHKVIEIPTLDGHKR